MYVLKTKDGYIQDVLCRGVEGKIVDIEYTEDREQAWVFNSLFSVDDQIEELNQFGVDDVSIVYIYVEDTE